ncbi:hypothetical protein D3C79_739100 [compost metagenome]
MPFARCAAHRQLQIAFRPHVNLVVMRHVDRIRRRALKRAHAFADMRIFRPQGGDGGNAGDQHQAQLFIAAFQLQRLAGCEAIDIEPDKAPVGILWGDVLDAPLGVRLLTFGKQ